MQYEVRYQYGGEETSEIVDAETAAEAARTVQDKFIGSDEVFELLQVTLLDEHAVDSPAES
jgi:hypothetical protein